MTGDEYLALHRREHPKKSKFVDNVKKVLGSKNYAMLLVVQCIVMVMVLTSVFMIVANAQRENELMEQNLSYQQHTFSTGTTTYTFDTDFYNFVKTIVMMIGAGLAFGWALHGVGFVVMRR